MTIKIKRQKKLSLQNKLQSVHEIQEAFTFLYPEYTPDEIKDRLLFTLGTIADSKLLQLLWNSTNELANKKVDEVSNLYVSFLSDTNNNNNNN